MDHSSKWRWFLACFAVVIIFTPHPLPAEAPDLARAVSRANEAFRYPGESISFAAAKDGSGVLSSVKRIDRAPIEVFLTIAQFKELLGGDVGSLDYVITHGLEHVLLQVSRGKQVTLSESEANSLRAVADALGAGLYYAFGHGVSQNFPLAADLFGKAAALGSFRAQDFLGLMYANGCGVRKDYIEAFSWFRKSADQGFVDGQMHLATMYANGLGVDKNTEEARKWFARAGAHTIKPIYGSFIEDIKGTGVPSAWFCKVAPQSESIPLQKKDGNYTVAASVNNAITLDFVIDTGASDVSIPADVVLTLIRAGTISQADYIDQRTYVLADGSRLPSTRFRLRSLKLGSTVLKDVTANVAPANGDLLLGLSALSQFKSVSIDNGIPALILSNQAK